MLKSHLVHVGIDKYSFRNSSLTSPPFERGPAMSFRNSLFPLWMCDSIELMTNEKYFAEILEVIIVFFYECASENHDRQVESKS